MLLLVVDMFVYACGYLQVLRVGNTVNFHRLIQERLTDAPPSALTTLRVLPPGGILWKRYDDYEVGAHLGACLSRSKFQYSTKHPVPSIKSDFINSIKTIYT